MAKIIQGSIPALVTPMHSDCRLDLPRFRALLDWHVAQGTDGVVVVGTSGESPTVDVDEHCELIATAVKQIAGRIPVIAGTGANSTREAIALASFAKTAGADAHLSVVPYYNRPTQDGLYRHFRSIAESVDLPMILYNVPDADHKHPKVVQAGARRRPASTHRATAKHHSDQRPALPPSDA